MDYWTEERTEYLRKLWSDGRSAAEIANELGGISRSAVCGKVHRLKLSGRGRIAASKGGRKPRSSKKPAAPPPKVVVSVPNEAVVIPISRSLKLVELTERTCKWPNGDPTTEDFSYCGNTADTSGPYCTYHMRIAYTPVAKRRQTR